MNNKKRIISLTLVASSLNKIISEINNSIYQNTTKNPSKRNILDNSTTIKSDDSNNTSTLYDIKKDSFAVYDKRPIIEAFIEIDQEMNVN